MPDFEFFIIVISTMFHRIIYTRKSLFAIFRYSFFAWCLIEVHAEIVPLNLTHRIQPGFLVLFLIKFQRVEITNCKNIGNDSLIKILYIFTNH